MTRNSRGVEVVPWNPARSKVSERSKVSARSKVSSKNAFKRFDASLFSSVILLPRGWPTKVSSFENEKLLAIGTTDKEEKMRRDIETPRWYAKRSVIYSSLERCCCGLCVFFLRSSEAPPIIF